MKKSLKLQIILLFLSLTSYSQDSSDIKLVKSIEMNIVSSEAAVQAQLDAYNKKDLEAFLAVYADDVEIYTFPDELQYKGKEEMRKLYLSFFERAGELHCQVIKRIVYGKYVMDREHVTTSIPGRESFEGQAIYEVKDGKIIKIWFMKL